jgi:hypothetical protein
MDLKEIGWESVGWVHIAEDGNLWRAVVNTAIKPRVPQKAINSKIY